MRRIVFGVLAVIFTAALTTPPQGTARALGFASDG